MVKYLKLFFDWSEVWAVIIPLLVLARYRKQPAFLNPVIIYLWVALFINLAGDIIPDFSTYLPKWLGENTYFYNIHSIIRFICFSFFFISLKQPYYSHIKKILPFLSLLFIIINFSFVEKFFNPKHISGNLLAAEAFLLLVYCLLYYLSLLKDENKMITSGKDFLVITGLSIYVVVNFFVFLFYVPMLDENPDLADNIWNVHNIAYLCLCIFIAKAFYEGSKINYDS